MEEKTRHYKGAKMIRLEDCPSIKAFEAFHKCYRHVFTKQTIMVSISGGEDSDIMLDLIIRVAKDEKIPLDRFHFVFFNTGIEYQATLKHLEYLEEKYGIKIERYRAITPVPSGCKKYGQPFLSKQVSENINRLQRNGFKWEDKDFDTLLKEYPKCKSALKWWCNEHVKKNNGKSSNFDISYNSYLKEFMIANPPTFRISQKCCQGAKKNNAHKLLNELNADLNIVGIRKAEGGVRATAYKSCFSEPTEKQQYSNYRPIFWFTDKDKREYEEFFNITHSDCYVKYGLKRTGCVGCPFGKDFEMELKIARQFEPRLYNAVRNIFKESYEYTRSYLKYREQQKRKKTNRGN